MSDRQKQREPAEMFKIHKQDAYVLSEISKTAFKIFSSSNIKEVTDLVNLTVSYRQNGVNPPKTEKIVLNTQTGFLRFVRDFQHCL